MEWKNKKPSQVNMYYLYKINGEWPIKIGKLERGDWKNAQNPDWFYISDTPIQDMDCKWFGPIPEP